MKKKRPLNPFLLTGYVSPEYFCDREEETSKLISALRNGRNVTLVSPRRMGKTGLIDHAFYKMSVEGGDAVCYYVDLYQTDSLVSLVNKLANAVLGTLDSTEKKVVKTVSTFFKSLRPMITVDPMDGKPSFSVDIRPELAEHSLAEVFQYMEQSGKECYVAFDEFQTITNYEDKNIEALLRSYIQRLSSVHFIFSGSQRHVLENMFSSASRPFYQSTQTLPLQEIPCSSYYAFAEEKLGEHRQEITEEDFQYLYNKLFGHTWYIQMLLNRLYETGAKVISYNLIDDTLSEIAEENEATYQTFLKLITPGQGKLLKAVATEEKADELLNRSFLGKYNLGATSSVKSAAKALVEKELLLDDNGFYQVYDRFFGIWLKRHFG